MLIIAVHVRVSVGEAYRPVCVVIKKEAAVVVLYLETCFSPFASKNVIVSCCPLLTEKLHCSSSQYPGFMTAVLLHVIIVAFPMAIPKAGSCPPLFFLIIVSVYCKPLVVYNHRVGAFCPVIISQFK